MVLAVCRLRHGIITGYCYWLLLLVIVLLCRVVGSVYEPLFQQYLNMCQDGEDDVWFCVGVL